jgi:hypothetical protein
VAGKLPTVTEEMLMGTVPLIDAVTDPIWFVPATNAGRELIVRELPTVTDEIDMGTVPLMLAVTLPICAVPAPMVTVPEMGKVKSELTPPISTASRSPLALFAITAFINELESKFAVTVPEMAGREETVTVVLAN